MAAAPPLALLMISSLMPSSFITRTGSATFSLDLLPDKSAAQVLAEVSHPRGSRSLSSHLKSRLGLDGIKSALLHELLDKALMADFDALLQRVAADRTIRGLVIASGKPTNFVAGADIGMLEAAGSADAAAASRPAPPWCSPSWAASTC